MVLLLEGLPEVSNFLISGKCLPLLSLLVWNQASGFHPLKTVGSGMLKFVEEVLADRSEDLKLVDILQLYAIQLLLQDVAELLVNIQLGRQ